MNESAELLVVMNEPEQRLLSDCLGDLPAEITWVVTPEDARAALLRRPNTRALVLDAEQAEEDVAWRKLAGELEEAGKDIAFLIATSDPTAKEMLVASKELPIADTLVKPYDPNLIRARVERALGGGKRKPTGGAALPSHPLET